MDQLPKNVRPTMHFKDDDVRLSFLSGNYVTLTNLNDDEVERLCRLKVSPINVSVHVTDGERRCMMLNNKNAHKVLDIMKKFASSGILMNAQIVLCKGINDREYLEKTIYDLETLYPAIRSISVVPVGISAHRDGLYPLESLEKDDCKAVISQVEKYQSEFLKKHSTRLVYLADEFYIKAGKKIPPCEYYEDFPQIENGVGLMAVFEDEINLEMEYSSSWEDAKPAPKTIATSYIAYDYIAEYVDMIKEKNHNLKCNVEKIKNNFFGEKITVTGLICGGDIISQLKGKELGEYLLISDSMLKSDEDIFLDDITVTDVERELGVKVLVVENSGQAFVSALMK